MSRVPVPGARPSFAASRKRAYALLERGAWAQAESVLQSLSGDGKFELQDCLQLALARLRLGHYADMLGPLERALARDPDNIEAAHLTTVSLIRQNRWAEALSWFERYAGRVGDRYAFVVNHATTLGQVGRHREAVSRFLDAMVIDMTQPSLHMKLGLAFKELKMYEEAAESFLTACTLDPRRFAAQLMVLHMRQYACAWEGFEASRAGIVRALEDLDEQADPAENAQGEGAVWALSAIEHPQRLFRKACAQVARRAGAAATPMPRRALPSPGERRVRVGYVSSDFHSHATALLMVEALECRDRERFEVTLYSHGKDDDSAMQRRIRGACERFVDVSRLAERDLAQRIHADGIDVLVDLKGHTHGNRLGVFAWRPAPVQVAWLGFPGTCGADYIDYIIGDRIVTPLEHAANYSEKIAQMPHSYQPNDSRRRRQAVSTRLHWGLSDDQLVLGNFNQSFKLTPETFAAWLRILHAVPNAVLWLLADNPQAMRNLSTQAQQGGIDPARLVFTPRVSVEHHLARLPLADFMIDNWPCSAHTTASDALWMGVPFVTLMGESFASRVAGSLLHAVGLGDLACTSVDQYVDTVVALANDPARVHGMRAHLHAGRDTFPLFDGARFARDLEALYERMVERARQGLPPVALPARTPAGVD